MSTRLFHILFSLALLTFSRTVPAQVLPALPVDPKIQKGTLRCGVAYYMVKNDEVKGYADFAIVRRRERSPWSTWTRNSSPAAGSAPVPVAISRILTVLPSCIWTGFRCMTGTCWIPPSW